MEKLSSDKQLNINKILEHIIGLLGNLSQRITIEFSKLKNIVQCPYPINEQQMSFLGTEPVLLESNIFIFSQMETFFQESLTIFNYNNQIQQNDNLNFPYCRDLINLISYTRFQIQSLILTIKAYENCQSSEEQNKQEQQQKSVDIFTKKFGKKGQIDDILLSINNVLGTQQKQTQNQLSFIQRQTISKALKIAKQLSEHGYE